MKTLCAVIVGAIFLMAAVPLEQRIAHTDPSKYRPIKAIHGGPGILDLQVMLDQHAMDTNLYFLHRGVLEPKSGIGAHFHNQCEEMFLIFDGEAQFTIDGRTSTLKGPAGAPCRMGHMHAIYNATDKPVQWMNINVSAIKGKYDAFDLKDGRVGVPLDEVPVFMTMRLDQSLLRPHAGIQYRRALDSSVFETSWAYVDHAVIPQGASIPMHSHTLGTEIYYVMSGDGTAKIGKETAAIHAGDAVPIQIGEMHSFENSAAKPLEVMIIGISSTNNKAIDTVTATQ